MNRYMIGFLPLFDAVDGGGGGGGDTGGGGSVPATGGTPTQTTQAPSAIDLADDSMIRIKGQEKPVKFNEYVRGFQSQFTKASQEAARLKAALQERETRLQQYEQERQKAQAQNQQQGRNDVFSQLEQLPYLSGKDARAVVESIGSAIQQRDQVLVAALKKIQALEQNLGGLRDNHTMQSFESKIDKWLADGGYDPGYRDLAKEVYLAYEGDDLDNEFPQIFSNRMRQLEELASRIRQSKIQAARQGPFVPGKGGNTGPSAALKLDPRSSPKQVVDQLWDAMQTNET